MLVMRILLTIAVGIAISGLHVSATAQELADEKLATLMLDFKIGQMRDGKFMKTVGIEKLLAKLNGSFFLPAGLDPSQTERIVFIANLPDDKAAFDKRPEGDMPLNFLARLQCSSVEATQELWKNMCQDMTTITVGNREYYSSRENEFDFTNVAMHLVNEKTIEFGTEPYVLNPSRRLVNKKLMAAWGTMPKHDLRIAFDVESERSLVDDLIAEAKTQLPPPLVGFLSTVKAAHVAKLSIDTDEQDLLLLTANSGDDKGTKQLEDGLSGVVAIAKLMAGPAIQEMPDGDQKRVAQSALGALSVVQANNSVTLKLPHPPGLAKLATEGVERLVKVMDNPLADAIASSSDEPFEPPVEKSEDFGEKYGLFEVNKFSEGAEAAIRAHLSKDNVRRIALGKKAGDLELREVCRIGGFTELEIQGKAVTTLEPVATVADLKELRLDVGYQHEPLDLKPLEGLTELEVFDSYATKILNPDALANCKKLTEVSLYMAATDSIDFAAGLPELRDLSLYGSHTFEDYSPLRNCSKLEILDIYMNPQAVDEKVAVLSDLTTLREIRMSNNKQQTNLNFVAKSEGLESINAMWCSKLSDISALKGKKKLRRLELDSTGIESIDSLADCESLTHLNISKTKVTDLSPLAKLTNLNSLRIGGLGVTDYSVLTQLKNLGSLYIGREGDESKFDFLKSSHPNLRIQKR